MEEVKALELLRSVWLDVRDLCCDLRMFAWLFWNGLRDSMQVRLVLRIFFGDKKIQQLFINCILLNLVIFVGSSVMYMFLVTPLFNYMATTDRDDFRAAAEWVKFFLDILWMVLWQFPVYIVSFMLNGMWYDRISERIYMKTPQSTPLSPGQGAPSSPAATLDTSTPEAASPSAVAAHPKPNKVRSFTEVIAEKLLAAPLLWCYVLITSLVAMLPYIGAPLALITSSWLYSLYCFENKWAAYYPDQPPKTFHKYMELHYVYFFGFGATFSALCGLFPFLISAGVFAFLFPAYLIMAARTNPVMATRDLSFKILPKRVRFFKEASALNDFLLACIFAKRPRASASSKKIR